MPTDSPNRLTATEAREALSNRTLTAEALAHACLDRVQAREREIGAWAHLDEVSVLEEARARDADGSATRSLQGIPVGIKDIFDTAGLPTELGSPLHRGRQPGEDSTVVRLLRDAGAVILGKTVTTEFAMSAPARTRNPHDLNRTPGGSSSGSAAAVADFMVPLAIGSQTVGSVIRPGAFCGVYAYKPTFGSISRTGMHLLSRRLDHVGVFARCVEDLALIGDALMRNDPRDRDMRRHPEGRLMEGLESPDPITPPRFAFIRPPPWYEAQADEAALRCFIEFGRRLGNVAEDAVLPVEFSYAVGHHHTILGAWLGSVFGVAYTESRDMLSEQLKERVERGLSVKAAQYVNAMEGSERLASALDRFLADYDAILTPATLGEAPADLSTTGDATFNATWTLCGAPVVNLPLLEGPSRMPLGVQMIGRRGEDAALLRNARWLSRHVAGLDAARA